MSRIVNISKQKIDDIFIELALIDSNKDAIFYENKTASKTGTIDNMYIRNKITSIENSLKNLKMYTT